MLQCQPNILPLIGWIVSSYNNNNKSFLFPFQGKMCQCSKMRDTMEKREKKESQSQKKKMRNSKRKYRIKPSELFIVCFKFILYKTNVGFVNVKDTVRNRVTWTIRNYTWVDLRETFKNSVLQIRDFLNGSLFFPSRVCIGPRKDNKYFYWNNKHLHLKILSVGISQVVAV